MITSVRFCLSYDILNGILSLSKCVDFSDNCIVITDVVMTLLVPAESVIVFDMTLSTEYSNVI